MKVFPWIIGIIVLIVLIPIVILLGNLIFISEITQFKIKKSPEFVKADKKISVIEEMQGEMPSSIENAPNEENKECGRNMLLLEDGSIEEESRMYEDDTRKRVVVASNKYRHESYVFLKNDVFMYADKRLGRKIGSFELPAFSFIECVLPVNDRYLLVHGAMEDSPYPSKRELWQIRFDGLTKMQLTNDPHYVDDFPPRVFAFENEQIVVYFTGSYSFAYGGDSSRPQFSVLRIYNSEHPEVHELIKIGFKAGTVLDVKKVNDGYLLITDPNLPRMAEKPRVPLRKWKIILDK